MTEITPPPYWAPLLAQGLMTTTQLGIPAPAFDYSLGHAYIVDPNPPTTRVPLDPGTWARTCLVCGWPLHPQQSDTTHPTCIPDAPHINPHQRKTALAEESEHS